MDKDGARLDVYLVEAGLGLSRRRIRAIIDVGGVYVNKKRVRIASRSVHRGDRIRMQYSDAALKALKSDRPEFKPKDLLFEQFDIFAVNKPPGMPAQATMDQSIAHVVPCLDALLKTRGDTMSRKYVLVHRLDKETSGVILVANGNERGTWLTEQFRERTVSKTYWAVCRGIPKHDTFSENSALSEIDRKTGDVRPVRSGGRSALTHFRLLASNPELGLSWLECRPETGRSHQIRVHLAMNDLPIVGDKRYGSRGSQTREMPTALGELAAVHHLLHARAIEFQPTPKNERVRIEAELPERFRGFLLAAKLQAAE